MPFGRRGDTVQGVDFREQHLQRVAVAQGLEKDLRITRAKRVFRLFPYPLRRQMRQFAGVRHRAHQRHGFIGNAKTEMGITCGKTRYAQYA